MVSQSSPKDLLLEEALLQNDDCQLSSGDGSVDFHGKPVLKSKTGNWRACCFILGNECCERLAYYGIAKNLVTYLTTELHEGNVSAARSVANWQGTCFLTPLLGALLADSYRGRYWTIVVFSAIYFVGLCIMTLSVSVSAFKSTDKIFLSGLYLIAVGTGGIRPCVSAFGADQFDDSDTKERVKKASFFNWYFFSVSIGSFFSGTLIVWIQENVGWCAGFGIPAIFMAISIASFVCGTSLYRFQKPAGSPLTRVFQVVSASLHKGMMEVPEDSRSLYEAGDEHSAFEGSRKLLHTDQLKFLDKASVLSEVEKESGNDSNRWRLCTVTQVEEFKMLIRLLPIWLTGIFFSMVFLQTPTLFVLQGKVMDRTIGPFVIPAASISTFDTISILVWIPFYDQILVPLARKFTGKERGFSELQRMGIGIFISNLTLIAAALVEVRRLQLVKELGLVNQVVAVPLTIFWQIPQFLLSGAAEVLMVIGQIEFFYNQSPDGMRSLSSAFLLLSVSFGSYLSSFIIEIVTTFTTAGGGPGWIADNLNEGRLDKFFLLLAGLGFMNLLVFLFCSMTIKPKISS